jgi:hypothetical protein
VQVWEHAVDGVGNRRVDGAAGATVWGYIVEGRGIGLVVSSPIEQLPHGITLIDLARPRLMLTVNAVWGPDHELSAIDRFFDAAKRLAQDTSLGIARCA